MAQTVDTVYHDSDRVSKRFAEAVFLGARWDSISSTVLWKTPLFVWLSLAVLGIAVSRGDVSKEIRLAPLIFFSTLTFVFVIATDTDRINAVCYAIEFDSGYYKKLQAIFITLAFLSFFSTLISVFVTVCIIYISKKCYDAYHDKSSGVQKLWERYGEIIKIGQQRKDLLLVSSGMLSMQQFLGEEETLGLVNGIVEAVIDEDRAVNATRIQQTINEQSKSWGLPGIARKIVVIILCFATWLFWDDISKLLIRWRGNIRTFMSSAWDKSKRKLGYNNGEPDDETDSKSIGTLASVPSMEETKEKYVYNIGDKTYCFQGSSAYTPSGDLKDLFYVVRGGDSAEVFVDDLDAYTALSELCPRVRMFLVDSLSKAKPFVKIISLENVIHTIEKAIPLDDGDVDGPAQAGEFGYMARWFHHVASFSGAKKISLGLGVLSSSYAIYEYQDSIKSWWSKRTFVQKMLLGALALATTVGIVYTVIPKKRRLRTKVMNQHSKLKCGECDASVSDLYISESHSVAVCELCSDLQPQKRRVKGSAGLIDTDVKDHIDSSRRNQKVYKYRNQAGNMQCLSVFGDSVMDDVIRNALDESMVQYECVSFIRSPEDMYSQCVVTGEVSCPDHFEIQSGIHVHKYQESVVELVSGNQKRVGFKCGPQLFTTRHGGSHPRVISREGKEFPTTTLVVESPVDSNSDFSVYDFPTNLGVKQGWSQSDVGNPSLGEKILIINPTAIVFGYVVSIQPTTFEYCFEAGYTEKGWSGSPIISMNGKLLGIHSHGSPKGHLGFGQTMTAVMSCVKAKQFKPVAGLTFTPEPQGVYSGVNAPRRESESYVKKFLSGLGTVGKTTLDGLALLGKGAAGGVRAVAGTVADLGIGVGGTGAAVLERTGAYVSDLTKVVGGGIGYTVSTVANTPIRIVDGALGCERQCVHSPDCKIMPGVTSTSECGIDCGCHTCLHFSGCPKTKGFVEISKDTPTIHKLSGVVTQAAPVKTDKKKRKQAKLVPTFSIQDFQKCLACGKVTGTSRYCNDHLPANLTKRDELATYLRACGITVKGEPYEVLLQKIPGARNVQSQDFQIGSPKTVSDPQSQESIPSVESLEQPISLQENPQ